MRVILFFSHFCFGKPLLYNFISIGMNSTNKKNGFVHFQMGNIKWYNKLTQIFVHKHSSYFILHEFKWAANYGHGDWGPNFNSTCFR